MPNIEKKNNKVAQGSVYDVAKRQGRSLPDVLAFADTIILFDRSGSMHGVKMGQARDALFELQRTHDGDILLIAFDSTPKVVYDGDPGEARGGTMIGAALSYAKELDIPGRRFILISDGCPQDEHQAISVAQTYTSPIHTIFIGDDFDTRGLAFMQRLAALSPKNSDLGHADVSKLEQKVAALLPEGKTHT